MYRFGINFSRGEEIQYCLDFWITTKGLEQLDSNYITDDNIELYEKLKYHLITYGNRELLVLCGIGSEITMPESARVEDIVAKSKNICMWILPSEKFDATLDRFNKETYNGFFVYSLKA